MIYTSYFANWRNLKDKKLVSIARFSPPWMKVDDIALELAPSSYLLRGYKAGEINQEQYTYIYNNSILSPLYPKTIYNRYDECVLLCYEKAGEFCHRRLVATWLENAMKERVPEIGA